MGLKKKTKDFTHCVRCSTEIPYSKRSDAKYCSDRCRNNEEKVRYCKKNPEYVKRQRLQVCEIRHLKEYGHTRFVYNPMENSKDRFAAARALGYRSMLEVHLADQLKSAGVDFGYETVKIPYQTKDSFYVADFVLHNGIIIEGKGKFVGSDRSKHLLIKEQHPELDIRFVFSNSKSKLYKGSKQTYGGWCERHGFKYSDKVIPNEWLEE